MRSRQQRRSIAVPRTSTDTGPAGQVRDGQIVQALDGHAFRVRLDGSRATVDALCPMHIDAAWLRAAVALGPVDVAVVETARRHIVWAVFPSPAHDAVRVDVRLRGRGVHIEADEVTVDCSASKLKLDRKGQVELHGKDVLSRASRINRVRGGAVRIN